MSKTHADSVAPSTYSATIAIGESVVIPKTVTIDDAPPTSAPVDVFLLCDTTGSMGGAITAVRNSALSLISSVTGLGDVRFGVGEYKDFGDAFAYRTNTDLTADSPTVVSGVNAWIASGGGDLAEANLFGLQQVASMTSWRPGSTRILVWFGDAPGHDPSGGVTEDSAIDALVTRAITVQALDVRLLNSTGQATRIAAATGGNYYPSVNTANLVSTIQGSISTALEEYSTVDLDLSGVPAGITALASPAYNGTYKRDVARTFSFEVTLTGVTSGTYDFDIPVLVDGGTVAVEHDSIVVGSGMGGSTTPPSCALTALVAGPPRQLVITVQDLTEGLQSIEVTTADNSDVTVPAFSPGDTAPVVVTAVKLDPSNSSQVALRVTDMMGTVTDCDPITPGSGELEQAAATTAFPGGGCSIGGGSANGLSALFPALIGLMMLRRRRQRNLPR